MSEIEDSADVMFQSYDEARRWVTDADLVNKPVVLEDWFDGEHIATTKVQGSNDRYALEITNHEGKDTTSETVVDATEVAEMMGGWTVAGREVQQR